MSEKEERTAGEFLIPVIQLWNIQYFQKRSYNTAIRQLAQGGLGKSKTHALRAVLNAKHAMRHASMSVGVLLHFNAAMQHIFDFPNLPWTQTSFTRLMGVSESKDILIIV